MKRIIYWFKKALCWFLDALFWLIDYWLKEIDYIYKEMIVGFIVGIISLICETENWYDIFFYYFILHWIYSCVRIGSLKEDSKGMSGWIDSLARRNEALTKYVIELEEELEKTRSQDKQS